jgi:hypothetical protein
VKLSIFTCFYILESKKKRAKEMSLSARKVNMLGLSGSFSTNRKTSGISSQATKNLANTSSASKSSLFNIRRSNFVAGQFVTKGKGTYNYSRIRAANNTRVYSRAYTSSSGVTNYTINNDSSAYTKGAVVGQILSQGVSLLNQLCTLAGGSSSTSTSTDKSVQSPSSNLGTVTAESVASSISSMESATDSSTLRNAISNAKAELTTMQNNTAGIESEGQKAQANEATLSDNVAKCDTAVTNAENDVSQKKNAVEGCERTLSSLNSDYAQKCSALDTAKTNLQTANDTLTQATSDLNNAESDLTAANNLPDSDPTKATKVAAAEAKVEQAKAAKLKAENAVKTATTEKTNAENAKTTAYNAITEGKAEIDKAEKLLTKSKEELKQSQDNLKTKQDELDKAKEVSQKATDAVDDWTAHVQDMRTLESKIKEQEKRLDKLQKSEMKEYKRLGKSISKTDKQNEKLVSSVDGSDGYSSKEQKALEKIKMNNADNLARRLRNAQLESNVVQTVMAQPTQTTTINGITYKIANYEGQTYYSMDNQFITEDEYKRATGIQS